MATAFHNKGFRCCLAAFRGCTGEDNKTPGAYHVGFTKDLDQLARYIKEQFPDKKIYLSGFRYGIHRSLMNLNDTF